MPLSARRVKARWARLWYTIFMPSRNQQRSVLGYDVPWHTDWLFWVVLVVSACGAVIGFATGASPWWQSLAALGGGVFIGGIILGSLREVVRGFNESRTEDRSVR